MYLVPHGIVQPHDDPEFPAINEILVEAAIRSTSFNKRARRIAKRERLLR